METLDVMEQTAKSIMESADCAIGYEAANMVYKGLIGYRDDYVEHILMSCTCGYSGIYRFGRRRKICGCDPADPEGQSVPDDLRIYL